MTENDDVEIFFGNKHLSDIFLPSMVTSLSIVNKMYLISIRKPRYICTNVKRYDFNLEMRRHFTLFPKIFCLVHGP